MAQPDNEKRQDAKSSTPIDRAGIAHHFAGFDVSVDEEDADGEFTGGTKHWHVFTVEAHRPA